MNIRPYFKLPVILASIKSTLQTSISLQLSTLIIKHILLPCVIDLFFIVANRSDEDLSNFTKSNWGIILYNVAQIGFIVIILLFLDSASNHSAFNHSS